jgi:RHS repeat-associated protein
VGTLITQTDFGYTGQRNNAYINLIDYGARFYSPALGRFTQPDSIVPDPANSQSLNRYSYVRNSPINYTDPTGHRECTSLNCDGSDDLTPGNPDAQYFPATDLNIDDLNDETQKEIYRDYIDAHKNKDSWLWDVYGKDGALTLKEFLAALMMGESENYWEDLDDINLLYQSEVREYYDYSNHEGLDSQSIYTLLSFVAIHYQSVHGDIDLQELYDNWVKAGNNNVANTLALMNYFQSPPDPSWKIGIDCESQLHACPYWSGNSSMFNDNMDALVVIRNNDDYVYWSQDSFLILTACVVLKIRSGTLNSTSITTCPRVRGQ